MRPVVTQAFSQLIGTRYYDTVLFGPKWDS